MFTRCCHQFLGQNWWQHLVKMTSFSSYLQLHKILTQEEKCTQLLFFSCRNSVLPLSYLYETLPVLDHNMNILSIFFEIPILVSHQNHHHQYTFFCLPNLDIGHKTDLHDDRNVGIVFVRIKEITALYPDHRVPSWKTFSNGPNTILPCECFNIWALFPKSHDFL